MAWAFCSLRRAAAAVVGDAHVDRIVAVVDAEVPGVHEVLATQGPADPDEVRDLLAAQESSSASQLEIEKQALSKEEDAASAERLAAIEQELADIGVARTIAPAFMLLGSEGVEAKATEMAAFPDQMQIQ